MPIIYLLSYIFGSILLTLASRNIINDYAESQPLTESLTIFAFGLFFIVLAAALHTVTMKQRAQQNPEAPPEIAQKKIGNSTLFLVLALTAWFLPLIAAWIQFELFVDEIILTPFIIIAGTCATVLWITSHLLPVKSLRGPTITTMIALFGLPLGIASNAAALNYFHYYQSDVITFTKSQPYESAKKHTFQAQEPHYHPEHVSQFSDEYMEIIHAIANAERVELDIEEELAAGRLIENPDGPGYIVTDPESPNSTGLNIATELDNALAQGISDAAQQKAKNYAAWQKELAVRKQSGRLFTRPPTPTN